MVWKIIQHEIKNPRLPEQEIKTAPKQYNWFDDHPVTPGKVLVYAALKRVDGLLEALSEKYGVRFPAVFQPFGHIQYDPVFLFSETG